MLNEQRDTIGKRDSGLTIDQQRALDVMRSGRNVFLSGVEGTGKSMLINRFISENRDRNVIVCGPDGITAVNVGGADLHRVFCVPAGVINGGEFNDSPGIALRMADIVIIDEINRCRIDIFEYVVRTLLHLKRQMEILGEAELASKKELVGNELLEEVEFADEKKRVDDTKFAGDTNHYRKQIILVGDFYGLPPHPDEVFPGVRPTCTR